MPQTRVQAPSKTSTQSTTPAPGLSGPSRPFPIQAQEATPDRAHAEGGPAPAERSGHSFGDLAVSGRALQPRGPGQPLPDPVRSQMEHAFGDDFSAVRIHQDGNSASIGATAYTRGHNIHFKPGTYQPASRAGQKLIGHELTHVVQQRAGRVAVPHGNEAPINTHAGLEREADILGYRAAQATTVQFKRAASAVQRKADVIQLVHPAIRRIKEKNAAFKARHPGLHAAGKVLGTAAAVGAGGLIGAALAPVLAPAAAAAGAAVGVHGAVAGSSAVGSVIAAGKAYYANRRKPVAPANGAGTQTPVIPLSRSDTHDESTDTHGAGADTEESPVTKLDRPKLAEKKHIRAQNKGRRIREEKLKRKGRILAES